MRFLGLLLAPTLAATLLIAPVSRAAPSPQQRAEARALVAEAAQAMKAKHWADAVSALRKARKLDPSTAINLELARALAASGKLTEARKVLRSVAEGNDGALAIKKAHQALSALEPRIPTVKLTIAGPPAGKGVTLVDGVEVNAGDDGVISLNPGSHTVGATADGFEPAEKDVDLTEGAHEEVELTLTSSAPKAASAPSASADKSESESPTESKHGSRAPGVCLTLLGVAPLVTGSIFGVIATGAASSAKAQCVNGLCPASAGVISSGPTSSATPRPWP